MLVYKIHLDFFSKCFVYGKRKAVGKDGSFQQRQWTEANFYNCINVPTNSHIKPGIFRLQKVNSEFTFPGRSIYFKVVGS